MPKSASRSLRSWLKSADSENSPPNVLINERSPGAEKDKKTSPTTHATPGKRVTRRNSQMDAAASTPTRTLRNTRRSSISENDNKLTASPLRRSTRRLSQTLEDGCTTPTKSRGKSVLIIDSPIKEENETSEVSIASSRSGRSRPRLLNKIKKNEKIEQVKNNVKKNEKTFKSSNSKSNSVTESQDSDFIIIIDDDDDEVDVGEGIKKYDIHVDERKKVDNIKENVKDQSPNDCVHENEDIAIENNVITTKKETTTANEEEICNENKDVAEHDCDEVDNIKENAQDQSPNDCVHEIEDIAIENNLRTTKNETTTANEEEICNENNDVSEHDCDEVDNIKENAQDQSPNDYVHENEDIAIENNVITTKKETTTANEEEICNENKDVAEHDCDEVDNIKENAQDQSPNDCVHENEDIGIENNVITTKNETTTANEEEICKENKDVAEHDCDEVDNIKENAQDQSPNDCVHENEDIGIENNVITTKNETTTANEEEICKENNDVSEHDCDEVINEKLEIQENDNEEAIVINVNEKQGNKNDEKFLVEGFGSINKKQESGPPSSEKQKKKEEQREAKKQKNFVEINSDIELNNSIKDFNGKAKPSEIENIAENEDINDIIVETINKSSPSSFVEQKGHKITTIICDKKVDNEILDANFTAKENREITNSFNQSRFDLAENQNKSLKELKGKSQSILNKKESGINRNNESFKKAKASSNKSKIRKSVTFDSIKKQSSIKYPTTPISKGKIYSDSFMLTLRNIDSSCETSANFNTSASFKDSEDEKSQQMSFNVEMCPSASDCDTPYKNLSEEIRVSSSTPLSILKNSHKKNDDILNDVNKLNKDLIVKEDRLETNEPESFSNVINPNEKDNMQDISLNSINEKELKNTECVLSQSCKELAIENLTDNANKQDAGDSNQKHDSNMVKNSISIFLVSSGSESDDEYESDSEKGKNHEGDKGETKRAEKDTLQLNYKKSNLKDSTNLAQNASTKETVLGNGENENRNIKTNLEIIKNGNDSKEENLISFKDISKNDYTPVINEEKAKNINLEQEACDDKSMLLTTDNVQEKKAKETSAYLNISDNDDEGIQNATEISKNTEKLQDNKEITEMTLNSSNKKTSFICQKDSENMGSEFQDPEGVFIINNGRNILKQDENSDILKDILSEGSNEVETGKECKFKPAIFNEIVQDINQEDVLGNDLEINSKSDISELQKSPEKKNDNVSHIEKTPKDSKVIDLLELLIAENSEIFDCNLEDQDESTADSHNRSISGNSTKSINLNITKDSSIISDVADKASPKIKNKNLVKNKNRQKPEEEINMEKNNNEKDVTVIINNNANLCDETISNLSSNEKKKPKLEMEKKPLSAIKNKSFDCSRKRKLCTNENNLSLSFVAFAENNVDDIDFEESKVSEENKSKITKIRSSSPVHSLNETFTSVHNLENINECSSDEVNNCNKEICNKSTTLQAKESEIELLQKIKIKSPLANEERIAPKCTQFNNLSCEEGTSKVVISDNMNKSEILENSAKKAKKLSKYSNDNCERLLVLDAANSNKITTSNLKTIRENTDNKVSHSTESENILQAANSVKTHSKEQSKIKVTEKKSKVIIDKENTSPTSTEKKLKKKLAAEVVKQNLLKLKKIKQDVIQSNISHKSMEKKLKKRKAKEIVQTVERQSSPHQKQVEKEKEKIKVEIKTMSNSKKLLPDDILEAIDKSYKKSKKTHLYDLEEFTKSKTLSRTESSNKEKLSRDLVRYSTSGGISDIIKNPSGIFFEEPITPDKKNRSKSLKNEKRKILSTIELPTGIVYEEPVTPDHKKIVNGFKETVATPRAIGYKVKRILSAGQKEPPVYKKDTRKKRKLLLDEPSMVLPKPKWATSGEFTVTKFPKAINLDESIATEFLVTPLQSKKSKAEAGLAPLIASAAYEFKKNALYNKQIPRETSKQLLQRKEKQKYYMF